MTKQIVYLATDSGVDGRSPEKVLYAAFTESARDAMIAADPSRAWRNKGERIVDIEAALASALAKLDGVDRLVLGLKPWPSRVCS